jgi:hypothetical protein
MEKLKSCIALWKEARKKESVAAAARQLPEKFAFPDTPKFVENHGVCRSSDLQQGVAVYPAVGGSGRAPLLLVPRGFFASPFNVTALLHEWDIPHRLMAMMIGTVTTSDSVERSSADADSASKALYLAASRTTIVARGKLQHTSASRANGLCT